MEHIIIALEAPMMSFGAPMTDNLGPTGDYPALSAITGLLANALGWNRTQPDLLQALQDHLVMGSRIDRATPFPLPDVDFQTAQLRQQDTGWTTRGQPESRAGSPATFLHPDLRLREYLSDSRVTTAFRINPYPGSPTHDDLVIALIHPARPLYIGRKPFIPSIQLFQERRDAQHVLQALLETPLEATAPGQTSVRLYWPEGEGDPDTPHLTMIGRHHTWDRRSWHTRLHTGTRPLLEATAPISAFQPPPEPASQASGGQS